MSSTYSWDEFRKDVELSESFLENVVESGDRLKRDLEGRLKKFGRSGSILEVGSTNPSRLTAITDPKTPGAVYPCDFDIVVVLNEELCEKEKAALLESLLPDGINSRVAGYEVRSSSQGGFPVHLALLSEQGAKEDLPVLYSQEHAAFTEDQIFNIRALRLWAMRNGSYGGFTDGFKGIAIEQMVYQHGYFDDVVCWLANAAGSNYNPEIVSPVNQKNLIKSVQPDVWSRVYHAAEMYSEEGLIKASPFGVESWDESHPGGLNLVNRSDFYDPRDAFVRSKRMVTRSLKGAGEKYKPVLLVVPYVDVHDVFISVGISPGERELRRDFTSKLMSRWNMPGSPGNSRHKF